MPTPKTVFILAGEASGDRLGADLMSACTSLWGELAWLGMGGPIMQKAGLVSDEDMGQLSIIGIGAALSAVRQLSKLADRLIETILSRQPEFIFTIDSKGFSVRFAKRLRKRLAGGHYQPKIIHMVAPTIWAWGKWRRAAFEQNFDAMMCLFPFEPELFDQKKLPCYFVGHPLGWQTYSSASVSSASGCKPVSLCLLPGSRISEINTLLPLFLGAISRLQSEGYNLSVKLPSFTHFKDCIDTHCKHYSELDITIITEKDGGIDALGSSHVMLAASGTVTLEAGLAGVPGVVAYYLPFLTRLFSQILFKPHTPVLPDILLNSNYYPFVFPPKLSVQTIATELKNCLDTYSSRRDEIQKASQRLRNMLTQGEPDFGSTLRSALKKIAS